MEVGVGVDVAAEEAVAYRVIVEDNFHLGIVDVDGEDVPDACRENHAVGNPRRRTAPGDAQDAASAVAVGEGQ